MAFADAGCILKIDIRCEQCKYKIVEVLSSIIGVYNVEMDGERGLVMIAGEVDPNVLLKSLARTGRHAELIRVNFKHPNWNGTGHYSGFHSYDSSRNRFPAGGLPYSPVFGANYPFRGANYGCGLRRSRPPPSSGYVPPRYLRRVYGGPYDGYYGYRSCSCCNFV